MLINIYIYKYSYIYTLIYIYMNVSDFLRTHVDTYQFMHINDNIYIYISYSTIFEKKALDLCCGLPKANSHEAI